MAIDIIGIILIVLFFIRGYLKGFIVAIFSVLAILLGILCALKLSQSLSDWLLAKGYITSGWVTIISYVILFIGVVIIVNLLARLLQRAVEGLMLGTINRLLGGLFYAFLGIIFWSSLLWICARMNIISHQTLEGSKTYPLISGLAPWFFFEAGRLIPFVQDTFDKLEHFFDNIKHK